MNRLQVASQNITISHKAGRGMVWMWDGMGMRLLTEGRVGELFLLVQFGVCHGGRVGSSHLQEKITNV